MIIHLSDAPAPTCTQVHVLGLAESEDRVPSLWNCFAEKDDCACSEKFKQWHHNRHVKIANEPTNILKTFVTCIIKKIMAVKFNTHFVILLFHCYSLLKIVTKSLKKKKTLSKLKSSSVVFITKSYNLLFIHLPHSSKPSSSVTPSLTLWAKRHSYILSPLSSKNDHC